MNLPKSLTFLGNFCKGVKIYHFTYLGNFYRHLAIFIWSHWGRCTYSCKPQLYLPWHILGIETCERHM